MKALIILVIFLFGWTCFAQKNAVDSAKDPLPKIWLECDETIFDEQGIPKTNVILFIEGQDSRIVGETTGCDQIDQEDFENFDIPSNALSGLGGWFAGAGDYYYVVYDQKKNAVRIFHGWQDELQADDGYHWEIHKTIRL